MIAISILAIILVISTVVLMGIGDYYTKGNNITNVQNDTRNITDELSSDIEFSGTSMVLPSTNPVSYGVAKVYAVCFGDIRYSYVIGLNSNIQHSLWRDKMVSDGNCYPLNLTEPTPSCDGNTSCPASVSGTGSDLISSNMHLAKFQVTPVTADNNLYSIQLDIALGENGDFVTSGAGLKTDINGNYICKNQIGQQFCATSSLSTMVTRRVGSASSSSASLSNPFSGGSYSTSPNNPYYCSQIQQQAYQQLIYAEQSAYATYQSEISTIPYWYLWYYPWYYYYLQQIYYQQYLQAVSNAENIYNQTLSSQGC